MAFSVLINMVACSESRSMVITPGGCGHASPSTCTGTVDWNSTLNYNLWVCVMCMSTHEGVNGHETHGWMDGVAEREREREREDG